MGITTLLNRTASLLRVTPKRQPAYAERLPRSTGESHKGHVGGRSNEGLPPLKSMLAQVTSVTFAMFSRVIRSEDSVAHFAEWITSAML